MLTDSMKETVSHQEVFLKVFNESLHLAVVN